jgi:hypothetical protein
VLQLRPVSVWHVRPDEAGDLRVRVATGDPGGDATASGTGDGIGGRRWSPGAGVARLRAAAGLPAPSADPAVAAGVARRVAAAHAHAVRLADSAADDLLALVDRYAALVAAKAPSAGFVRARISTIVFQLGQEAADYRLVSDEVAGKLMGGWDDDAAEVAIIIAWARHMASVHHCAGRFCQAGGGR